MKPTKPIFKRWKTFIIHMKFNLDVYDDNVLTPEFIMNKLEEHGLIHKDAIGSVKWLESVDIEYLPE